MFSLLSKQPLLVLLLGLAAATILFTFSLPTLVRVFRGQFGQLIALRSRKLLILTKQHPTQVGVLAAFLVLVAAVGYFLYLQTRPVTLTAVGFVAEEKVNLDSLQKQTTNSEVMRVSTDLIILDVRPFIDFQRGHIKGTVSWPLEKFRQGNNTIYPPRKVAVYGFVNRLSEVKEVADALSKQKLIKIYVIKDGYEGLVAAGLKTQESLNSE